MLGVKAKPAKAGRFASPDPCARIVPSSTMSFADRPGLPAGHVSKAHGKATRYRRGQFWTPIRGHFSAPIDSLEEAGDRLFTFTRYPPSQWKSIRTTNAIERLHEEFKRRIKTQTVPPSAETAAMLFWALLASGQIVMRKVDGWASLAEKPSDQVIDLAA